MIDLSQDDQEKLMATLRFARWALEHAADIDHDRKRFDGSRLHRQAITYCILASGELVGKVKYNLKKAIPHILWGDLVGMRHRLAHDPTNINPDLVWGVITDDFPLLIETLEPMFETAATPAKRER